MNVEWLLRDDVTGVRLGRHVMQGHAGSRLAVDQHPIERRPPAIGGQERSVQVQGRDARKRQQRVAEQAPVPHREDHVGVERGQSGDDVRLVRRSRRQHGHTVGARDLGHGLEPVALRRLVVVGDHRHDRLTAREERRERARAERVIPEHDEAAAHDRNSATT